MADDAVETLCRAVDEAALMADMRVFAQRTKLSGTAEELESFRYLQQRMDDAGFRTELVMHDALISLPGTSRVVAGGRALASITHSFSRASPADGVTGRLIDVDEGRPADVAGQDLRGAILLVQGIASPGVAARAAQAGAAGQLHVSPHEHLHEMCISPVWGSPSEATVAGLPATVAATISFDDGTALRDRLRAGEALTATLHAEVDTGWRKTPILVADLDGPDPGGPFILLSGHHDTWFEGVMDNGGANATMIEVARQCAQARDRWRRGLRVCFWSGHSHGRYSGSAWYVDQHWDELDRRCAAHVNVDSTGGIGATELTGSMVSAELAQVAATAVMAETGQVHGATRLNRSSDMSFLGVGIPSMFGSVSMQPPSPLKMRNALGWWWHTRHDLLDKIDPGHLVRDTRVVLRAMWPLLTDPVLPLHPEAQLDGLLAELRVLADALGNRFALKAVTHEATALRDRVARMSRATSGAEADRSNAALMRVARALVPLDYTSGDRFSHDPALPLPAWPSLSSLRALAACRDDADSFMSHAVSATRARNRLLHALRTASAALAAVV